MDIVHNEAQKRFELNIDGELALVDYIKSSQRIIFTHTEVPVALEGQGIGSKLAKHVLQFSKDNDLKVQPMCPFIRGYIQKHPEWQDHLTIVG